MTTSRDTRRLALWSIPPHLAVMSALLLALATPVQALDPTRQLTQYGHTAWRIKAGFFTGAPISITQAADGYIWIGTQSGVMRFDGVRFVPWTPPGDERLPSGVITSLLGTRDGAMWIGSESGLSRWANGRLTNFTAGRGTVVAIVEDRDGSVWYTRARKLDPGGSLCQIVADNVRCFGASDGLSDDTATYMILDPSGDLWLGAVRTLYRGKPGRFHAYQPGSLIGNADMGGVTGMAPAADGGAWVGIGRPGEGAGLQRLRDDAFEPVITPDLDARSLEVSSVLGDRDGGVWVGTLSDGIYRVHNGRASRFRVSDGLSGDNVFQFYEDREGTSG